MSESNRRRASTTSDENDVSSPPAKRRRQTAQEYGFMRDADGKGSTYFLGSGSGIYFIRSVLSILARNSTTQQPLSPEEELVPGEDDRLQNQGQSKSLWRSHEVVEQTDNTPIPSFDSLVDWSRSYFETWHRAFPFLHAPSVLHSFNRICDGDIRNIDPVEAIIVRSIMSICIHDRRQKIPQTDAHVPSGLVFATVQDALAALQVALCRPTSIAILQAVVAVQVFLMSMLHYNSASRIGGLLVRMAHQLGLHRCPARFSRFSVEEVGIRRRLWWSIYCFERHLAQSLGLPLDIRDDDVDVCYPGREEHSQEKENGVQDERLWLLTSLAKHAKLRGLILELRNKSIRYRQENSDQAVLIHAELSKWWNEVQDMWDIESDHLEVQEEAENEKQPRLLETHRILIGVLKQELIISLNRPLLASKAGNNSYAAALQNCIGASQQIISILRKSLARKSAGSDALPAWPSLTSAVWMSCFVLIYAAVEGNFPVKSALRSIDNSLPILNNIAQRGSFWPAACAATLKDLRDSFPQLFQDSQKAVQVLGPDKQQPSTGQVRPNKSASHGTSSTIDERRLTNQTPGDNSSHTTSVGPQMESVPSVDAGGRQTETSDLGTIRGQIPLNRLANTLELGKMHSPTHQRHQTHANTSAHIPPVYGNNRLGNPIVDQLLPENLNTWLPGGHDLAFGDAESNPGFNDPFSVIDFPNIFVGNDAGDFMTFGIFPDPT